jgi:hypothetical protein
VRLPPDVRAEAALVTMQRNREQLLAVYAPAAGRPKQFPRSATFRWVSSHLSGRALASTLLSAALLRPAWVRMLSRLVLRRGAR